MNAISGRRIFRVLLLATLLLGFTAGGARAAEPDATSGSGTFCLRTPLLGGRTICV